MDGLLVIDKSTGMTSRDVVNLVQQRLPRGTRIGHTGTLDPLATGVLVLCIGAATKLADRIQAMPKTYRTVIRFGATSDTDDADGRITEHFIAVPLSDATVRDALSKFVGSVEQIPPAFSAVKVGGRRAYAMARRGQTVALGPRIVRIDAIDVLSYSWPRLELEIQCGKGTYIRSLARDLGAALSVGGMVETLRRLTVGPFAAAEAIKLPFDNDLFQRLLPLTPALAVMIEKGFACRRTSVVEGTAVPE